MARIYLDDFVVEYSLSQDSFNVQTLREMLHKNAHLILERGKSNDYLVIGVAQTREETDSIIGHFLRQIEDRKTLSEQ